MDIKVRNLRVHYKTMSRPALNGTTFSVCSGALAAIVGLSGTGKTTLLMAVADLIRDVDLRALEGEVTIAGTRPSTLWSEKRIGVVFQNPSLLPWLTASQNVAFPADLGHTPAREPNRARELVATVGIAPFADRYPHQLSGGQQQRVALARALVTSPAVLLLDEPFGHLDQPTRSTFLELLRGLHEKLNLTTVLVTHDLLEAAQVADTAIVLGSRHGTVLREYAIRKSATKGVLPITEVAPVAQELNELLAEDLQRGYHVCP